MINSDVLQIFKNNLTVIVGENDCGKTSLIDCLNILTHNKPVEIDDFSYGRNELKIGIEIEDFVFEKNMLQKKILYWNKLSSRNLQRLILKE